MSGYEIPCGRELTCFDKCSIHGLCDACAEISKLRSVPPLVRYCPECGYVGPLPPDRERCCADSHAADVPETFIEVMQRAATVIDGMLKEQDRLIAEATLGRLQAQARATKLEGLILKALDSWWPFVHGAVGASNTAKNLRQQLSDGVQPEGVPKFDGCL